MKIKDFKEKIKVAIKKYKMEEKFKIRSLKEFFEEIKTDG